MVTAIFILVLVTGIAGLVKVLSEKVDWLNWQSMRVMVSLNRAGG